MNSLILKYNCPNKKDEGKAWCGVWYCTGCFEDIDAVKEAYNQAESHPESWAYRSNALATLKTRLRQLGSVL